MFPSRRSRESSPTAVAPTIAKASSTLFAGLFPVQAQPAAPDSDPGGAVGVEEANVLLNDGLIPLAFQATRHVEMIEGGECLTHAWRMRERMKTVSVALVICLNVGVDPPDVTKTHPCARSECWIDPATLNPTRALEAIGNNLQKQYERWQPRARYKQSLDPTVEEVRRLATGLRRNARDERVLFHYNGHGVPKPTANGEIWVFNRSYTQYIPLSLYDLQQWMGSPSIFVYDCSNAGIIVSCFDQFACQHEREYLEQINTQGIAASELPPPISLKNCIQLAACSANQLLPMNPELPADLFTACLTTPIKMALRWFVMQNKGKIVPIISVDMLDKIPGQFGDRRTMLGELNWIFTAITDTIAWNALPRDLFQKLFRQDLLVASLFRNFLLAERIMRSYDCTPISAPALPPTHQHPMWKAWDLAVDMCLNQLVDILERGTPYHASSFFEDQLTAFQVWLKYGTEHRNPPEQLPIVLQVLLSQAHRLRALDLLSRFLDLGPWAVNLALSVGIFPYVLKLLQSSARELRPLLVSIWAKILAVDTSCQNDLIRDGSHKYFLSVLQDSVMMPDHRTWAAFVLASIVHNYKQGQLEAEQGNIISICLEQLEAARDPILRQWLAITLGRVWDKHEKARWRGARDNAHEKLYALLKDPAPEVRASAVFALGTFINSCEDRSEHANSLDHAIAQHLLNNVFDDGSPLVRQELVVVLQYVVMAFEANFVNVCRMALEEEERLLVACNRHLSPGGTTGMRRPSSRDNLRMLASTGGMSPSVSSPALDRLTLGPIAGNRTRSVGNSLSSLLAFSNIYTKIYSVIATLASDPFPQVASMADVLLSYLKGKARERREKPVVIESASVPSSPAKPSFILGGESSPPASEINISVVRPDTIDEEPEMSSNGAPQRTPRQHSKRHTSLSPDASMLLSDAVRAPDLTTEFLAWSAKYFTKQLMDQDMSRCSCDRPCDCGDKESKQHWRRKWLFERNDRVRATAAKQRLQLSRRAGRIDEQVFVSRHLHQTTVLAFHPFENHLAVAGPNQVIMYDISSQSRISTIHVRNLLNGTTPRQHYSKGGSNTQITSLHFLNAHQESLVLTGLDDGTLKVYRDYDERRLSGPNMPGLVTAWSGMRDLVPHSKSGSRHHAGLVTAWDQNNRCLFVGGDTRIIRLWDADKELRVMDLSSGTDSFVSSLTCGSTLLGAGFGDGSVKMYDRRAACAVISHREHGSPILDCQIQADSGLVVSGSTDGEIRIWDSRNPSTPYRSFALGQPIVTLSVHPRAPLLCAWTATNQSLSLHSLDSGSLLNSIRYHEGILGQRLGPVANLAFHPNLLQLASGSTDCHVNVFAFRKTV